jgi:VIT1/CCC1 family predicted Fe2+/Mn2+ transporter
VLGALAARVGGASMVRGALRVCLWSALAMAFAAAVGHWFGVAMSA